MFSFSAVASSSKAFSSSAIVSSPVWSPGPPVGPPAPVGTVWCHSSGLKWFCTCPQGHICSCQVCTVLVNLWIRLCSDILCSRGTPGCLLCSSSCAYECRNMACVAPCVGVTDLAHRKTCSCPIGPLTPPNTTYRAPVPAHSLIVIASQLPVAE